MNCIKCDISKLINACSNIEATVKICGQNSFETHMCMMILFILTIITAPIKIFLLNLFDFTITFWSYFMCIDHWFWCWQTWTACEASFYRMNQWKSQHKCLTFNDFIMIFNVNNSGPEQLCTSIKCKHQTFFP